MSAEKRGGSAAVFWNRLRDPGTAGEQQDEQSRDAAGRDPNRRCVIRMPHSCPFGSDRTGVDAAALTATGCE